MRSGVTIGAGKEIVKVSPAAIAPLSGLMLIPPALALASAGVLEAAAAAP